MRSEVGGRGAGFSCREPSVGKGGETEKHHDAEPNPTGSGLSCFTEESEHYELWQGFFLLQLTHFRSESTHMPRRLGDIALIGFAGFIVFVIVQVNKGAPMPWLGPLGGMRYLDKAGHFFLMGVLSFLAVVSIAPRLPAPPKKATLQVLTVLLLLIAAEEISQHWIPSRTFSVADFCFDLAGVAFFGCLAYRWISRASAKR
ncbi:VanZ family protein [Akkermansiaceae bacterium]|nr:VanZ family protein [Akkermansiaceae bacterium]MDB4283805.1 VanZ family protein [Akkermansiaceae bacterium]